MQLEVRFRRDNMLTSREINFKPKNHYLHEMNFKKLVVMVNFSLH